MRAGTAIIVLESNGEGRHGALYYFRAGLFQFFKIKDKDIKKDLFFWIFEGFCGCFFIFQVIHTHNRSKHSILDSKYELPIHSNFAFVLA